MFPDIQFCAGRQDFLQMVAELTDLDMITGCWRKLYLDISDKPTDPEDQELNQPRFLMVLMVLDSELIVISTRGWNLWA